MNTMKLIILLGLLVIFSGTVASAQTAAGAGNVTATMNAPGRIGVFDGAGGNGATAKTGGANDKIAAQNMNLNSDPSFESDMQHPMGFAQLPGSPPQPATGPSTTSSPGTNRIGTFGSGQSAPTNPVNPITLSPPGGTTIVQGQTGETTAVTPGTSGTASTGGTVPGTTPNNTTLTNPIPGTQSIGTFGSGQTIVTNRGNTFSAAPPGGTTITLGPTGETSAITPGTSGTGSTGGTVPGTTPNNTALTNPIPGTQSIGTFGSGQTIVTNRGNTFTFRLRVAQESLWAHPVKQARLLLERPEPVQPAEPCPGQLQIMPR